jgi:hypothetical protein
MTELRPSRSKVPAFHQVFNKRSNIERARIATHGPKAM